MQARRPFSMLVAVVVGIAIHLDWHAGRPGHGHLSFGLPYHWLLALPVFAWSAWYVVRRWPNQVAMTSALSLAAGVFLGQVLEPLYELAVDGWPLSESFGATRLGVLAAFMAAGLATYLVTAFGLIRGVCS